MKLKRIGMILGGAAILGIGIWYFGFNLPSEKSQKMKYRPVKVEYGKIQLSVTSAGTIYPKTQVEVKSKASGKILKLFIEEGSLIRTGQLLVALDKTEEETKVRQCEADVMSAQAQVLQSKEKLQEAARTETQTKSLLDAKLTSLETFLKAQTAKNIAVSTLQISQASLISAQERLKNEKISYADTEIRAPINGIVLQKLVEEGQIIASGISASTGGTQLLTVGDMSHIIVKAEVDEVDIGKIKIGQEVRLEVDAFPNQIFQGKLTRILPQGVNKSNVTVFNIEIDVTDPQKSLLKAGMTATAKIMIDERTHILTLPTYAIQTRRGKPVVLIRDGKQYTQKTIKTGITDFDRIEILSGLSEGDEVYFVLPDFSGSTKKDRGNNSSTNSAGTMRTMRAFGR